MWGKKFRKQSSKVTYFNSFIFIKLNLYGNPYKSSDFCRQLSKYESIIAGNLYNMEEFLQKMSNQTLKNQKHKGCTSFSRNCSLLLQRVCILHSQKVLFLSQDHFSSWRKLLSYEVQDILSVFHFCNKSAGFPIKIFCETLRFSVNLVTRFAVNPGRVVASGLQNRLS